MAISYRIDPALRRIEIVVTGILTNVDVVQFHRQVTTDPEFRSDLDLLCDFQDTTSVELDAAEMQRIVASTPFGPTNKRALVSGDRPFAYGIGRMYGSISADRFRNLRLFRSRAEAIEWLAPTTTNEVDDPAPPSSGHDTNPRR